MSFGWLSPSKAQGQGDSSLRTPQSDNCQSSKLELVCRQLENRNRTLSNFEARLDHLSHCLDKNICCTIKINLQVFKNFEKWV
jgi:hypothetical protein